MSAAAADASKKGGFSGDPEDGRGFYRAALSTHLSFITGVATAGDGCSHHHGGVRDTGKVSVGVGEASRTLRGDVAGVRQVGRLECCDMLQ